MIENLNKLFDHTLLKPEATEDQIRKLCNEAIEYDFYSVCINSIYVPFAYKVLKRTNVKVCTVIDFPFGCSNLKGPIVREAALEGAKEFDMVIPVGLLKSGYYELVKKHIENVVQIAKNEQNDNIVKVILEIDLLKSPYLIELACQLSKEAGADFVKTSTGFVGKGATVEVISLMRSTVGDSMGVKASGGIRTYSDVQAMVNAGANRIGSSMSVFIMNEYLELNKER